MNGINASVRAGLRQDEADWPKLWVPPFSKHLCVCDRNKKKERGKRIERRQRKRKGKEERSRLLTNHITEILSVYSSWEATALRNS